MGINKKIESGIGKVLNLDLEAKKESENNIKNRKENIEKLAFERSKICATCEHNEIEPIKSERVIDEVLPDLSNRMCGKCFCPLPKLLRQNKKKCKLKKW